MNDNPDIYDRIISTLADADARFRVIEHSPEGRTEVVSEIRGNAPRAAAKAMVIKVKRPTGPTFVLAVVPGDRRVNMDAILTLVGGRSASFAAPADAERLTACVMGAVPPFTFDDELTLLVDEQLAAEEEIFFNAARLDRSLAVDREGYLRAASPRIARLSQ